MSEYSIVIDALGKQYRLYHNQRDRMLDTFFPAFMSRKRYDVFWALRGVSLKAKRGERIGIIGHNGAGKSTLLKCITGGVTPTEGSIDIQGRVQALLELGTGFHPEFTGLENINSYLSYQGLSRKEIQARVDEIVDFAELGEFIGQPVKTYSAGMYTRLAFSAATSVNPEVLIIDEILGAGDAYFFEKSLDRIKNLALKQGATVLFVSHDMASVQLLCDRAIWLERGEIFQEGNTIDIAKAYARQVRQRTEQRMRQKNRLAAKNASVAPSFLENHDFEMPFQLTAADSDACVHSIAFSNGEAQLALNVGATQDSSPDYDIFIQLGGQQQTWGKPETAGGKPCRRLAAPPTTCQFKVRLGEIDVDTPATFSICYKSTGDVELKLLHKGVQPIQTLASTGGQWHTATFALESALLTDILAEQGFAPQAGAEDAAQAAGGDAAGAKPLADDAVLADSAVQITSVRFLGDDGQETPLFTSFGPMTVEIEYQCTAPAQVEFAISLFRMGVVAQQYLSGMQGGHVLSVNKGQAGVLRLVVPSLALGGGRYYVSIGAYPPINHVETQYDNVAYSLLDRRFEIEIKQPEKTIVDLGIARNPYEWTFTEVNAE